MTQNLLRVLVLNTILSVSTGCHHPPQPPLHPVRGSVSYKGKPAAGVVVVLRPTANGARLASGTSRADGTFQIGTRDKCDGASAGEYVVTVTWPKTQTDAKTGDELTSDLLNGRYADPARSPWKITVREGDNVLDPFKLD